jgi:hypothetical protein
VRHVGVRICVYIQIYNITNSTTAAVGDTASSGDGGLPWAKATYNQLHLPYLPLS